MSDPKKKERREHWIAILGIIGCVVFLAVIIGVSVNAPLPSYTWWREMDPADRDGLIVVLLVWILLTKGRVIVCSGRSK